MSLGMYFTTRFWVTAVYPAKMTPGCFLMTSARSPSFLNGWEKRIRTLPGTMCAITMCQSGVIIYLDFAQPVVIKYYSSFSLIFIQYSSHISLAISLKRIRPEFITTAMVVALCKTAAQNTGKIPIDASMSPTVFTPMAVAKFCLTIPIVF